MGKGPSPGCPPRSEAGAGAGHHEPGSGPPYQDSMIRWAMDTGGGSSTSSAGIAARNCFWVNYWASAISSPSTRISWLPCALARNPSIRLCGNGHGWLPT